MSTIAEKLVEIDGNVDKVHATGEKKGVEETVDRINKVLDLQLAYAETFINNDEEERVRVGTLLDEEIEKLREWEQKWNSTR